MPGMAENTPNRAKGGSKLAKTEITTVRLDPKLRYLAELAARKQRRTLSSFIEWVVEQGLKDISLRINHDGPVTVMEDANRLWDVDTPDRFVKLALLVPDLLTHDEQIVWKVVRECGYFWRGEYKGPMKEWTWHPELHNMQFDRLRAHWDTVLQVAVGEQPAAMLPRWHRTFAEETAGSFDDMFLNTPEI